MGNTHDYKYIPRINVHINIKSTNIWIKSLKTN